MRALLDVNVLIALIDQNHSHHQRAALWFLNNADNGWASCAITQNGCLRVLSQPSYPNTFTVIDVASRLATFTQNHSHQFWPDAISLLDPSKANLAYSHGAKQLTDIYLLALATENQGRLITFDRRISLQTVPAASAANLTII